MAVNLSPKTTKMEANKLYEVKMNKLKNIVVVSNI